MTSNLPSALLQASSTTPSERLLGFSSLIDILRGASSKRSFINNPTSIPLILEAISSDDPLLIERACQVINSLLCDLPFDLSLAWSQHSSAMFESIHTLLKTHASTGSDLACSLALALRPTVRQQFTFGPRMIDTLPSLLLMLQHPNRASRLASLTMISRIARSGGADSVFTYPGLLSLIVHSLDASDTHEVALACRSLEDISLIPAAAVSLLLLGVVPKLLSLLPSGQALNMLDGSHLRCLSALTLTFPVRALLGETLVEHSELATSLVNSMQSPSQRLQTHASAACAMMLLDEKSAGVLERAGAHEVIAQWAMTREPASTSKGNAYFNQASMSRLLRMTPLLDAGAALTALWIYWATSAPERLSAPGMESVRAVFNQEILPIVRIHVLSEHAIVSAMAQRAVGILGDTVGLSWQSLGHYVTSLQLHSSSQVLAALSSEQIELIDLMRANLTDSEVSGVILGLKIKRGDALRFLSSVRSTRSYIDATTAQMTLMIQQGKQTPHHQPAEKVATSKSVFISYSWANKIVAQRLRDQLESAGVAVWIDEQSIKGGQELWAEIDKGISDARVVVACLSERYSESVACRREIQLAEDRKKVLLPVIVEEIEQWPPRGPIAPLLAGRLYIKMANEGDFVRNASSLVEAVKCSLN